MFEEILMYLKLLSKIFNFNHIFLNLSQLAINRVNSPSGIFN